MLLKMPFSFPFTESILVILRIELISFTLRAKFIYHLFLQPRSQDDGTYRL